MDTLLQVDRSADTIRIDTGQIEVEIDTNQFNLFRSVKLDGKPTACSAAGGIKLVDEHGISFTQSETRPKSVTIEENGPCKVVIRIEGDYANKQGEPT